MAKRIASFLILLLCCCFAAAGAWAGPPEPTSHAASAVIAIVDVQKLLQESLAARGVQQQLETQRAKFQTEVAAEEEELRQAEQRLAKMRDEEHPTPAYAQEEQKLRQRFLTVEREVQARRKALDQAFTDSMNEVRGAIVETVAAISKERGVNLAIVKQQVIWNEQAIDITDEVLVRLNKTLPKLDVKISPLSDPDVSGRPVAPEKKKTKQK